MLTGIFNKSMPNPESILKNLDILCKMVKQRKITKTTFSSKVQQIKQFNDKFETIINGVNQWLIEKDKDKDIQLNKISVLQQNQAKYREECFIKLLTQCRTNFNISLKQLKQKIKISFYNLQNCESIGNLMWEIITKNKNLYLIQQKLKVGNQTIDAVVTVSKLIEELKQNKAVTEAYQKVTSQFSNFPNEIKFSYNVPTIKDKDKQRQFQSNRSRMFELLKAITKINVQISNAKLSKNNSFTLPTTHIIKSNKESSCWEQLLVKPVQTILKQNDQQKQYKIQYDLVNKIMNDLVTYRFDKFGQNIYKCDPTVQQNIRKIKKQLQQSATTVKNIYRRMVIILTRSNFMNQSQLQSQAIQKSCNTNILLSINEKRLVDIQNLFTCYDDLIIQIRKMEVVKKKISINKNKKCTLKEEIALIIQATKQLQAKDKKQCNTSPSKQMQGNITLSSYPKIQNLEKNNWKSTNQYSQQMQTLMINWIQLCKTVLESEDNINTENEKSRLQQCQFYMSQFDQIVREVKNIRTYLNQEQQRNLLLTEQIKQSGKIKTQNALNSVSEDLQPVNTVSQAEIDKQQILYLSMCDQLGKEQTANQKLKNRNDKLIQQKKQLEKQINLLTSQLLTFKNLLQIKDKQIKQQQQQSNSMKNKNQQFLINIGDLNRQIIFNKSQITNLQASKDKVQMSLAQSEADLQAANTKIRTLTNDTTIMNSNYINEKIEKQKIVFKSPKEEQNIKINNNKMKQQLKILKQNSEQTNAQLLAQMKDLSESKSEIERMKQYNQQLIQIIENQQKKIKEIQRNINLIDEQKQKSFTQLNQKYSDALQKQKKIEELTKLNLKFKDQIEKLQKQEKESVNIRQQNYSKQNQFTKIKKKEQKYQQQAEQLQKLLAQSITTKEQLEAKISQYKEELLNSKRQNDQNIAQIKRITEKNHNLIQNTEQQSSQLKLLQQSIDTITKEKQFIQAQLTKLQDMEIKINGELIICKNQLQCVYSFLKSQIFNELTFNTDFGSTINQVKKYISSLKNQLNVQRQYVQECKKDNNAIYHQKQAEIQNLKAYNKQFENNLKIEISNCKQQLMKLRQTQLKYQSQAQNIQKLRDQLQEYKNEQYCDKQSWVCNHKETLIIAKTILKQIARINNKQFKMSNLLYKYSPQDRLTWNHFSGKCNILIIIKTVSSKMIAAYSLAPLIKPNTPYPYKGKQRAFIFESGISGDNQNYYYLLPNKKVNGCYGNVLAFGKSDLRFTLGDDTLQGNFGYDGTCFECNDKKIPQLLGNSNNQSKVKMISYQIYQIFFSQKQIQDKSLYAVSEGNIHERINKETSNQKITQTKQISLNEDFEYKLIQLENTVSIKNANITELNLKLTQADSQCKHYKQIVNEKEIQLQNCNIKINQLLKAIQDLSQKSNQLKNGSQKQQSSLTLHDELNRNHERQIQSLKGEYSKDLQKLKDQITKLQKIQKEKQSLLADKRQLKITINGLQTENGQLNEKISELQLQLATYSYDDSFIDNSKDNKIDQNADIILSLQNQLETMKMDTLPQKQKALETANREISQFKQYFTKKEEENKLLIKQRDESQQKIAETEKLSEESANFYHQKQIEIEKQKELLLQKIQILEQKLKTAQNIQIQNKTNKPEAPQNNSSENQRFQTQLITQTKTQTTVAKNQTALVFDYDYEQKFRKLATDHGIDPYEAAQLYSFFNKDLLLQLFPYKLKIAQQIQRLMKKRIVATKLVFEYDHRNTTSFHKYIEEKQNLVCVIKTVHNVYLATYYSGKYTKSETMIHPGLIFALTNNKIFELHTPVTNPTTNRAFRGMIYDEFFMIWGNAEVRIRANDKILFSNFGIAASFFNPRGKKVNDLICEEERREVEYQGYEIYQITFDGEEKKKEEVTP